MKVLVAEDNALLGNSIKRGLEEEGWVVDLARDGKEALYYADASEYDVLVLDWMLPQISGLEVLGVVRGKGNDVPVIMVTARSEVVDRVQGLDRGADDYLSKPFEMIELVSRLNALYRRSIARGSKSLTLGNLNIELDTLRVSIGGRPLDLTGMEYNLLVALAGKANQLQTRTVLLGLLYPFDSEPDSNSLDVLLNRLRRKLAGADVEIETVRGKGLILRVA
ncbi:DNA-binding response OmpR family regulator [Pseudomonas sp. PvR086]|nr:MULTISPECIES: response regulator transcription factor [Pseudomonas]PMY85557.1 DNA-binding response regulator [Pseudomonas sp. FW303-C2]PNA45791.1 DNA-binding response regulator [Pseudomonas sp. FW306-2-2C-A10BC]PNA88611.1 DNA-binding response regulator [Pseudomonas sp. MPR-R3B]MBD9604307.1 response regulator transcription factor [Pseudomonas sp. PDM08]MDR7104673.1 DNA-binding response OmpR family regulator [Pseudomonas frederiksbergensis]